MCTGGRVLHHLRHRLGDKSTRVIIAGFQAEGTLGRRLVERHPRVRIFGEEIEVKASVHTMGGFSAHAGCTNLLNWAGAWAGAIRAGGTNGKGAATGPGAAAPHVFLTHGENGPRAALAGLLKDHHGIHAALPALGQRFGLN
jgi:metallo-beta-lactamase family protein